MGPRASASASTRSVFNLAVERIRGGYYSDSKFTFSKEVLEDHRPPVTMQS